MPLIVKDRKIYRPDGLEVKEIRCPKRLMKGDLSQGSEGHFQCQHCSEKVINTDYMTEDEVVAMLEKEPDTCLFINLANPIFKVER